MNRNNLIGWIFLVICTIAAPLHAQNSVKVKGAQGRWQVSEEIWLMSAASASLSAFFRVAAFPVPQM